ncbi:MarR family transcriptional regulator [Sporolactobacillus sp. CQH2019]|uniref:MarR family winged helix-turn-helix transcriptional regulator n=1 Tax=Sporolactobacillus sp. CQH2019 TaxID=3023512 RepID=UPI00236899B2|nr:MarR family transcriptional regulator [Sporolactobacillus sp. CQH2019]MDD9150791.1 MarR family transcriptional regulator [Sporolactobacillus sp. CQH2019]
MTQNPTEQIAYLAWQLAQAVAARVERDVRRLGLSGAQSLALIILRLSPDLTVADIARRTKITPQSIGTAIKGLISSGLVQAAPSTTDKRIKRLSLTPGGRQEASRADEIVSCVTDDILAALDPGQQATAREIMTRMLERLNPDALRLPDEPARSVAGSGRSVPCEVPATRRNARVEVTQSEDRPRGRR